MIFEWNSLLLAFIPAEGSLYPPPHAIEALLELRMRDLADSVGKVMHVGEGDERLASHEHLY